MKKEIAEEISFELIERYTKDQRRGYRYPDDFNGDTIDRANDCANKIIEIIKAELDK